jgi:predicted nucleic acid-binding protein
MSRVAEYLLDTDHLSYVQDGHPGVIARLSALSQPDRVVTSVINLGEMLRGVYLLPEGRRKRELLQLCRETVGRLEEVLPLTPAVGEQFATTDVSLRRKGRPIPINDVWIASAALVRGATLVTNDAHFTYVDGLHVENWTG